MQPLADAGYHVLAPDYLGYGYSSKPTDVDYDAAFFTKAMHELALATGASKIVPVGNSLGGVVALEYTLTHPAYIEKLILMAPGGMDHPANYAGFQVGLTAMFKWVADRPTDVESFRRVLNLLVHNVGDISDEAVRERFAIALSQPKEVWARMRTGSYAERLGEITCPVLAFWGAQDKFIPVAQSLVLVQRMRDIRLVISSRAGHWFMIEEKEDFNRECIEFLAH
jgi:4,5:9,10-diseco-3-hydroxy-5,9,17-trioxoandrosta-1(10),2-diene-4-oate hydrolase